MNKNSLIIFKIYILDDKSAVINSHRFAINWESKLSFPCFTKLLLTTFPQLSGKKFKLYWKDNESDNISVENDEDLSIAFSEIQSETKKFYVALRDKQAPNSNFKNLFSEERNIICDGCGGKTIIYWYHCLQCNSLNLCEKCERQHWHPHHIMLRVAHYVPQKDKKVCSDDLLSTFSNVDQSEELSVLPIGGKTNDIQSLKSFVMEESGNCDNFKYFNRDDHEMSFAVSAPITEELDSHQNQQHDSSENSEKIKDVTNDNMKTTEQISTDIQTSVYPIVDVHGLTCEIETISSAAGTKQGKAANCLNEKAPENESSSDLYRETDEISLGLDSRNITDSPVNDDWSFVYGSGEIRDVSSEDQTSVEEIKLDEPKNKEESELDDFQIIFPRPGSWNAGHIG